MSTSLSTSATTPAGGNPTTQPPNPPIPVVARDWLYLHIKIVPRYNDEELIQHADDMIDDGTWREAGGIDSPASRGMRELINDPTGAYDTIFGNRHEVDLNPIGNAIESYQGWKTCEILYETITLDGGGEWESDTDGTPIGGSGLIEYAEEALCETQKVIFIAGITETRFYHFVFRMRTEWASANYIDVDQYVLVVAHDACGTLGAS